MKIISEWKLPTDSNLRIVTFGKVFPLKIGRPSGRSLLENKIIIELNKPEYYIKYPAIKNAPIPYPWSSQVTIPININNFTADVQICKSSATVMKFSTKIFNL
jgi:hypothetical protein